MDARPQKTIIFTIARMNPPTSGHMGLIQALMETNINLSPDDLGHGRVYIILSSSQDPLSDPLSCPEKKDILNGEKTITEGVVNKIKLDNPQYRDIDVIIYCMNEVIDPRFGSHPILKHVRQIITNENPTDMKLIIGQDRGAKFDINDQLIPKSNSYEFVEDDIRAQGIRINESKEELKKNVLARTAAAMSATKMRRLATLGDKADFITKTMVTGLTEEEAANLFDNLYSIIRGGILTLVNKGIPKKTNKANNAFINFLKPLNKSLGLTDEEAFEIVKRYMIEMGNSEQEADKQIVFLATNLAEERRLEEEKERTEGETPSKKSRKSGGMYKNTRSKHKQSKNKRSKNKRSKNKRKQKKLTHKNKNHYNKGLKRYTRK